MKEVQKLIVSAYEQARSSGKPDWNKMTTAVLKNRLLDLTRGAFDETAYGATSFTDFVLRNEEFFIWIVRYSRHWLSFLRLPNFHDHLPRQSRPQAGAEYGLICGKQHSIIPAAYTTSGMP